jgi:hypothetical protein
MWTSTGDEVTFGASRIVQPIIVVNVEFAEKVRQMENEPFLRVSATQERRARNAGRALVNRAARRLGLLLRSCNPTR